MDISLGGILHLITYKMIPKSSITSIVESFLTRVRSSLRVDGLCRWTLERRVICSSKCSRLFRCFSLTITTCFLLIYCMILSAWWFVSFMTKATAERAFWSIQRKLLWNKYLLPSRELIHRLSCLSVSAYLRILLLNQRKKQKKKIWTTTSRCWCSWRYTFSTLEWYLF